MTATRGPAVSARPATVRASKLVDTIALGGRITDLPPQQREWFTPIGDVTLAAGERARAPITIPQPDAARLLLGFVRFVADIAARTSLQFVWERGQDELAVDGASIGLTCSDGLLTVGLTVSCDELRKPYRVAVPFAVGRADAPRGLLMSTIDRIDAPALIADGWSDAIIAFCWEALLEVTRRVSAQAGSDSAGRPLIPGAIAAHEGQLLVLPMARHDLSGLSR
jgi:hypothetical protein